MQRARRRHSPRRHACRMTPSPESSRPRVRDAYIAVRSTTGMAIHSRRLILVHANVCIVRV